ncbi:acyl carrier protein [Lachnospiraceae bacterium NK3A20]|nr:acyl carrier protein [Lachnospiraceae bacterium NK3A20]
MSFEELKALIVDTLGCEEEKVTPEAKIMDDLDADSLDLVELHMELEEKLGIKIPDETLAKMSTVQDIVDYLNKNAE